MSRSTKSTRRFGGHGAKSWACAKSWLAIARSATRSRPNPALNNRELEHVFAFKPGPRNYDRTWIRDGSSQALALLWAGLVDEAKRYVIWYSQRIYETGMVPPILNVDGLVNRGYGSDIEFDAQGEFVGVAADVYRVTKDRTFLDAIFEPSLRDAIFLDALCQRTTPCPASTLVSSRVAAPLISHEGYNKPSYSYWDNYFALSACATASISRANRQPTNRRRDEDARRSLCGEPDRFDTDDRGAYGS